jgi:hypothetical protein
MRKPPSVLALLEESEHFYQIISKNASVNCLQRSNICLRCNNSLIFQIAFDRSPITVAFLPPDPGGQKRSARRGAKGLRKNATNFNMHIFANGYNFSEELPAGYAGHS